MSKYLSPIALFLFSYKDIIEPTLLQFLNDATELNCEAIQSSNSNDITSKDVESSHHEIIITNITFTQPTLDKVVPKTLEKEKTSMEHTQINARKDIINRQPLLRIWPVPPMTYNI